MPTKYHEADLSKAEAVCIDRCVAKFQVRACVRACVRALHAVCTQAVRQGHGFSVRALVNVWQRHVRCDTPRYCTHHQSRVEPSDSLRCAHARQQQV